MVEHRIAPSSYGAEDAPLNLALVTDPNDDFEDFDDEDCLPEEQATRQLAQ